MVNKPIKLTFFEYIEYMYKTINYRTFENKNKYLLLDFKKPTFLEDEFLFYFRFIDMYMGEYLESTIGKNGNNYEHISQFVDKFVKYFKKIDCDNLDNLKQEINSLRNHYIHNGYYLFNRSFDVTGKNKKKLYSKELDYNWLERVTKILKLGSYIILYKDILKLDIDECEMKLCCEINN